MTGIFEKERIFAGRANEVANRSASTSCKKSIALFEKEASCQKWWLLPAHGLAVPHVLLDGCITW